MPAEFVYKEVETRNFTLASWQKVTNPAAPYKIYIEGDGYAFNARGKATQDQTPRGTLVRELAFGDDSQNVIYFARPYQYIKSPICSKRHWTTARFALEVINAEYEAIKNIADNNPVKTPDYANMSLRDELQTRFAVYSMNQSKASPLPFLICACILYVVDGIISHILIKKGHENSPYFDPKHQWKYFAPIYAVVCLTIIVIYKYLL